MYCYDYGYHVENKEYDTYYAFHKLTEDGQYLWKAYIWLKNYNIMPGPGSWTEQTSKFIKTVEFCDNVNYVYTKRTEDKKKVAAIWDRNMRSMHAKK